MRRFTKDTKGFTLIELLVVMAIIGTLATLFVANFNAARERARDVNRKSDLRNIQTALRLYKNDAKQYPVDSGGQIVACGSGPSSCAWGNLWDDGSGNVYMKVLPADPSPNRTYVYSQISIDDYELDTCLENTSDSDCLATATCTDGCVYRVEP